MFHTHVLQQVMAYMEAHYSEEMNRETLARMAGMSVWHFSRVFKEQFGMSPSDYLSQIRVNRAKEQLLTSRAPVKKIAAQVGFADEFYFSRKFKKAVGIAPSAYLGSKKSHMAIMNFPYVGHLLALGVVPSIGAYDQNRDRHRRELLGARLYYPLKRAKRFEAQLADYNLQVLRESRPELIVCSDYDSEAYGLSTMQKMGPTVVIPWLETDWRTHFAEIAAISGEKVAASHWLDAYERKAEAAAELIAAAVGSCTVSLWHMMEGTLVAYGRRNGGSVLYDDLHLSPAYDLDSIEVYRPISAAELADYAGAYMLIVVDKDALSQARWTELQTSPAWLALAAVQERRVYELEEMPWLDYSPFAHDLIVDEAVKLFCGA